MFTPQYNSRGWPALPGLPGRELARFLGFLHIPAKLLGRLGKWGGGAPSRLPLGTPLGISSNSGQTLGTRGKTGGGGLEPLRFTGE